MTPTLFVYTMRAISAGLLVSIIDGYMGGTGLRGFAVGLAISLGLSYLSVRGQRGDG